MKVEIMSKKIKQNIKMFLTFTLSLSLCLSVGFPCILMPKAHATNFESMTDPVQLPDFKCPLNMSQWTDTTHRVVAFVSYDTSVLLTAGWTEDDAVNWQRQTKPKKMKITFCTNPTKLATEQKEPSYYHMKLRSNNYLDGVIESRIDACTWSSIPPCAPRALTRLFSLTGLPSGTYYPELTVDYMNASTGDPIPDASESIFLANAQYGRFNASDDYTIVLPESQDPAVLSDFTSKFCDYIGGTGFTAHVDSNDAYDCNKGYFLQGATYSSVKYANTQGYYDMKNLSADRIYAINNLDLYNVSHGSVKNGKRYFNPAGTVNRGAMAEFLWNLMNNATPIAKTGSANFVDLKGITGNRLTAIKWLASEGISVGTTKNGKKYYNPKAATNRGAMAEFLWNLVGKPAITKPIPDFVDLGSVTGDRLTAIKWLASEGISVGTTKNGNKYYEPTKVTTRGAMAEFLWKLGDKRFLNTFELPCASSGDEEDGGSACSDPLSDSWDDYHDFLE